jgi:hypothetical protein
MIIKITPNIEKSRSILRMIDETLAMINEISIEKYPSNIIKEYYDIIRELISVVLLLDGYKTSGESAHKELIEYLNKNYKEFAKFEIGLLNDLRILKNRISYDGFFVKKDYVLRKQFAILKVISKLKAVINRKMN